MKNKLDRVFTVGKTNAPYTDAVKIKTETGTGALKTIIVVLILLAQMVFFIVSSIYFASTRVKKTLLAIPLALFCNVIGAFLACALCRFI